MNVEIHDPQREPELCIGRERLLRCAERLFAERGFNAVSIRDIAQATGLSHGAIYHHFTSKEDLFLNLLAVNLSELVHAIRTAAAAPGVTRDRIARICRVHLSWAPEKRRMFERALRDLQPADGRVSALIDQARADYVAVIESVLRDGIARGEVRPTDPRLATVALRGMLWLLATDSFAGEQRAAGDLVPFVVSLFFEGIETGPTELTGF
jgi:AcrR family transcriptional regulator